MKVRGFEKIENGVTILDTFINEEDYKEAFEDYADYSGDKIEERHGDVCTVDSDGNEINTLYAFATEQKESESEDFWDGLRRVKDSAYIDYYVVTGSLGLWDGRHAGICETFDSLYEALSKCSSSAYDIVVKYEDGAIKFENHHHDGVNYFEIRNISCDDYYKVIYWDEEDGDVFDFIKKHSKPISWQMIGQ